jgi:hypothetical protein
MKLTKDEAYILACAIQDSKYNLVDACQSTDSNLMTALDDLEERLFELAKDQRRKGRKSQNSYTDILKRYSKKSTN